MQALVLDRQPQFHTDFATPTRSPTEALLRITLAGICGTDLELCQGYYPFRGVLGHEFVGVVEACADAAWVGRRVTAEINFGCGGCAECLAHGPEHCPRRRVLGIKDHDGVFADYACVPTASLHALPDSLADGAAVFVEPVAAALRLREQRASGPTDRIAVLGAGRLGLLVAQVLGLDGAAVTVLARRAESLAVPRALGLATRLAGTAEFGAAEDGAFDLVVEATGSPEGLSRAIELARPRGTIALKSTYAGRAGANLSAAVVKELTLVGSRCGPFAPAVRLLARGAVRTAELIEARYPLSQGVQALEHAGRPGALKVLLEP